MSLKDAAKRRSDREQSASVVETEFQERQRDLEADFESGIALLTPLVERFRPVAKRQERTYHAVFEKAHKAEMRRAIPAGSDNWRELRSKFVSRHSYRQWLDVILIGKSTVLITIQADGVFDQAPASFTIGLNVDYWAFAYGALSLSDYSPPGTYNMCPCLVAHTDDARYERPNAMHHWSHFTQKDRVYGVVEELITLYLDGYGYPYSDVE